MLAFVLVLVMVVSAAILIGGWLVVSITHYYQLKRARAIIELLEVQAAKPAAPDEPDGWKVVYKEKGKTKTYIAKGSTEGEAVKDFMLNGKTQFSNIVSVERK